MTDTFSLTNPQVKIVLRLHINILQKFPTNLSYSWLGATRYVVEMDKCQITPIPKRLILVHPIAKHHLIGLILCQMFESDFKIHHQDSAI